MPAGTTSGQAGPGLVGRRVECEALNQLLDDAFAGCDLPARRPGVWDALVGRDPEVDLITSFFGRTAADGGAVWFIGDPGVGKTVLLKAATDAATEAGTRILWAAGAEFEADLAFS